MKSLRLLALSTALAGLALTGCERHSFDETKGLHMEHGKHHGEGHAEGHGEAHAKDEPVEKVPGATPEAPREEPRKTGI